MNKLMLLLTFLPFVLCAQSFAPEPGSPGSTAIYKDSSAIVNWASSVEIVRGPMDIQNQGAGNASFGSETDGLGSSDGIPVSLGDGGVATLTFPFGISNGAGPDFAVFENGFTDHYMEFAHVEVSSDGVNFFRFPSVSEVPVIFQLDNFSISNCAYVHNLAGKYRAYYGTPFDLEDLSSILSLDVQAISHVRLIDVVGSIDSNWGTLDGLGNIINDPYPTPFESGGFDLDAVAVLHEWADASISESTLALICSPNPTSGQLQISTNQVFSIRLQDIQGKVLMTADAEDEISLDLTNFPSGMYFVSAQGESGKGTMKIIKE